MGYNEKIKGITVEIGGETTQLTDSLKSVDKAARRSSNELKEINRNLKLDPTNTVLLAQKQKVLSESISAAAQKLDILKAAEKSAREQFDRNEIGAEQMRALQREVVYAENKLKKLRSQYDEVKAAADQANGNIEDTAEQIKEVGEESEKSASKVSTFGDVLKGSLAAELIADGMRAIGSGIREIGSATMQAGADAETAMAKVATIAGTSALPLDKLQAQIMELSTQTGISFAEIAESVYSAISGGVDTANAVTVVEKATKLAAGGFTDTATAIDVLTTAINAYGLSAEDAAKLSDYLLTTQNLGKTTVDELAGAMGKVIPLASAYGVKMDNLSSAYAILTANGIATADSTTYVKAMLKELGDSGSTVAKLLAEQTGKSFAELNAKGMSLGDVLGILGASVDGDTGKFNELWSSSEAGIGALSLLGSGAERYDEVLGAMRESAGLTEQAYATMTDTFAHRSDELKNTLSNLEIEGFDGFKEAVKDTMGAVNKELQSEKTKTAVKNLGKTIGTLTADLSKLAVKALPVLSDALAFTVKNSGKLTTATLAAIVAFKGFSIVSSVSAKFKGLTAAFNGFSAAVSANPIGYYVTAISALISALSLLDAAVDTAEEKQERLAKAYKDGADAALEAQQARASAARDIADEYDDYRDLLKELDGIVDANGRIKAGYEERAAYITGRLSEVTGIEITITDDVIQKYGELAGMLDTVLRKKQADAMLTSMQGDYQTAKDTIYSMETDEDGNYLPGSQAAYEAANAAYNAVSYQQYILDTKDQQEKYDTGKRYYDSRFQTLYNLLEAGAIDNLTFTSRMRDAEAEWAAYQEKFPEPPAYQNEYVAAEKWKIAEDARLAYDVNAAIVANYEALQNAVWSGNDEAIQEAINNAATSLMTAPNAAYSSLATQLEAQTAEYQRLVVSSQVPGSSITDEQIAASEELMYRAFYEAYTAAVADGAEPEALSELVDVLSGTGAVTNALAAYFGEQIAEGRFRSADKFVDYVDSVNNAELSPSALGRGAQTERRAAYNGVPVQRAVYENQQAAREDAKAAEMKAALDALSLQLDDQKETGADTLKVFEDFHRLMSDSPIIQSEMPLRIENEATAKSNILLGQLLSVISKMDLTLVLDDGTLVARTIGKTSDALGIEAAHEKRGRLN